MEPGRTRRGGRSSVADRRAPRPATSAYRMQLLGGFALLRQGSDIPLPPEAQRLVAFLSLHGGRLARGYVAGTLWADGSEVRAFANLRSTLWRLRRVAPQLVDADAHTIALADGTTSDVQDLDTIARRLLVATSDGDGDLDHRCFAMEFLPGWYDEWVVVERERLRQLGFYALESIAEQLIALHRYGAAIQVILLAISLDTIRESPRRQLVRIHIVEGNVSEAIRQFHEFASMLDRELGLRPSPAMCELVPSVRRQEPVAAHGRRH